MALDQNKLTNWPEVKAWLLKTKPKQAQDTQKLFEEIQKAGPGICKVERIQIKPRLLGRPNREKLLVTSYQ